MLPYFWNVSRRKSNLYEAAAGLRRFESLLLSERLSIREGFMFARNGAIPSGAQKVGIGSGATSPILVKTGLSPVRTGLSPVFAHPVGPAAQLFHRNAGLWIWNPVPALLTAAIIFDGASVEVRRPRLLASQFFFQVETRRIITAS